MQLTASSPQLRQSIVQPRKFGNVSKSAEAKQEEKITKSAVDSSFKDRIASALKSSYEGFGKKSIGHDLKWGLLWTVITLPLHAYIPGSQLILPFLYLAGKRALRATQGFMKGAIYGGKPPVPSEPKGTLA